MTSISPKAFCCTTLNAMEKPIGTFARHTTSGRVIKKPVTILVSPLFDYNGIRQPKNGFERFFGDIPTTHAPAWDWAWRCIIRIATPKPRLN